MDQVNHIYVVIMAGGVGTRFWPYSRQTFPKQFQDILQTGSSLLQQTYDRFLDILPKENVYVATNERYISLVQEQLPFLEAHQILAEPSLRNTAPCIAYAAYKIHKKDPNAILIVSPADHVILKVHEFQRLIRKAVAFSENKDVICTLGIKPTRPDTGYGYIQSISNSTTDSEISKVLSFKEKPIKSLAEEYIKNKDFTWNAGLFIWSTQTLISAFNKHASDIHSVFSQLESFYYTEDEKSKINEVYPSCRSISVDYAIMEPSDNVYVLEADIGWSDLGTWKSAYELSEKDAEGNTFMGHILAKDSTGCFVKTTQDKLVVLQGVKDLFVVEKDNVLLICHQEDEQKIKQLLEEVKLTKGTNYL